MNKKSLIFVLPFTIIAIQMFFPYLEREMLLSSEEVEKLGNLFTAFFLPISIIVGTVILVEEDRKVSGRKRSSYGFTFFIFIPLVIVIMIYGVLK